MQNQSNSRKEYIGELTVELAELARQEGLSFLANLLEMAAIEAGIDVQGNNESRGVGGR